MRVSEGEMAGQHLQYNEHEFGQTTGNGEGQGGLAGCSPWACKESDKTGQLNNYLLKNIPMYHVTLPF